MAGKNQVTLTLAGDASQLEKAFASVGDSSAKMATEVGASSRKVGKETADGFDKAAEASDNTYSKFDALESVGRGTTDTMSGLGAIMKGDILQGSTDLAGGVAALADGFTGALLPAIKGISKGMIGSAIGTARQTVALGIQKVAMVGSAIATNGMAIAQKALNLAMRMNPIGLIITALLLLGTGLVLAYKKSATFRAIVQGAFAGVKTAMGWVVTAGGKVWEFFKFIGPKIGAAFKGLAATITAPFRAAFDGIKWLWNNTIGGKGFSVPSWVPEIGGKGFTIPYFHTGGIVPGSLGSETLAVLKAGERVTGGSNSASGGTVTFRADGLWARQQLQMLKHQIKIEGGLNVVFDV
jgi:hypothetical protein